MTIHRSWNPPRHLVSRLLIGGLSLALAASPLLLRAQERPHDICQMLGDRADRNFSGRPGNLAAVVGPKVRLIYMAGDLSVKSSLFAGKVVEWRPDAVQLQPGVLFGPEKQPLVGIEAEKYCWVGPRDTLLAEHVFKNSGDKEQTVRLTFDLQGAEEVTPRDGKVTFKVASGYPRAVLSQLFGAVGATHPVTVFEGELRVDVTVQSGKTQRCVVALAVGPDVVRTVEASVGRADAREESTRYWNRMLTEKIPAFSCSDAYLEKLYYFRWWSLLTKLNVGGFGHWAKPLAREGTVGFNSLISYSGGPSTIDLRWMRSSEWAYGNIESFYDNLHDGRLANHIYPDVLDGDNANNAPGSKGPKTSYPYHNFLVKALADVHALHPDKARLRKLWPALQEATALYENELDADHDGLYETYPWSNITGQEFGARFLYFHPFDKLLSYKREWLPKNDAEAVGVAAMIERSVIMRPGLKIPSTAAEMGELVVSDRHYRQETVDENCYAYVDLKALGAIAEALGEKDAGTRWRAAAEKSRGLVLAKLWDPATTFFYDRDGVTKEWALVKAPTGFYPFWAGIGGQVQLPIFKHLFNPSEFWTPFPVPTISMDYPKLAELRNLGWTYWNWNNWPMTTSHVADAAARAAKELDPSLVPGAAELLMKYTKVHFMDGDLKRPCVSEHFDPITGAPNSPTLDYGHSYYIDLVMRHVVGIEADPISDEVRIHPLDLGLERFAARNIRVKGHDLNVIWKPGDFSVSVDGKVVATSPKLAPLKVTLEPRP
ncbi:MAG: hypothetical protein K8R23_05340 [Chthoniobacter sp.]|nr:hypothetical protein [Chthoniobacter sp.]